MSETGHFLRWSHDLLLLGPYFALGRVLASFALGSDSVAGLPLLRGAATLNGSSVPHGHETLSGAGHFSAHDLLMSGPLLYLTLFVHATHQGRQGPFP